MEVYNPSAREKEYNWQRNGVKPKGGGRFQPVGGQYKGHTAQVSIRKVVYKRFIGKDPHVQEQQTNSGKADMSRQHEEEVQTRPAPGKRMGDKSNSRWKRRRPAPESCRRLTRSNERTSTRLPPRRWRVQRVPAGRRPVDQLQG